MRQYLLLLRLIILRLLFFRHFFFASLFFSDKICLRFKRNLFAFFVLFFCCCSFVCLLMLFQLMLRFRLFLFLAFFATFTLLLFTAVRIVTGNVVAVFVDDASSFGITQPRILLRAITARFHVSGVGDVRCLRFEWQRTFIR